MSKTNPWYTSKKSHVYHNNKECKTGDNIQPENVRKGTGGRALCSECNRLNRAKLAQPATKRRR